jgi:hypothetical protein
LPIRLIAYLRPSWRRLTTFWFPVARPCWRAREGVRR